MKAKVLVSVKFKPEIPDSHGTSMKKSLAGAGFDGVIDVRTGKIIEMELEITEMDKIDQVVDEMCRKLLAHPVSEDYTFTVELQQVHKS